MIVTHVLIIDLEIWSLIDYQVKDLNEWIDEINIKYFYFNWS